MYLRNGRIGKWQIQANKHLINPNAQQPFISRPLARGFGGVCKKVIGADGSRYIRDSYDLKIEASPSRGTFNYVLPHSRAAFIAAIEITVQKMRTTRTCPLGERHCRGTAARAENRILIDKTPLARDKIFVNIFLQKRRLTMKFVLRF